MKVITTQYLKGSVVTSQLLGRARPLGILGCISAAGIFLGLFLVHKFVSIWLLQFISSVWWLLQVVVGQLLYCITDRGWIVGTAFAGGYINPALDEIEAEREFTRAERDALKNFADSVRTTPVNTGGSVESNTMVVTRGENDAHKLRTIRHQFRETVMSVPGYDTVYDEGFDESFTAEFGEELGVVVKNGSQFTPPMKQMLLQQISTSVTERERHLDAIATEQNSVKEAKTRLPDVDPIFERTDSRNLLHCSFKELLEQNEALERLRSKHEQILTDRQHEIHKNNKPVQHCSGETLLQEYLYRSLETPFPVLSAVLERITAIETRQRTVIKFISRRY